MPKRRCAWPNCPQLVNVGTRYCKQHKRENEQQRGTPAQRGYDTAHKQMRAQWAQAMALGARPTCKRCGKPVKPTQSWDLGHDDSRTQWTGPEHSHCNRSAGQANSVRMREHWR